MALTLSGSNGVAGVDGSAGTPALQGSDSNTGIAFGADTIIGSTGGSERFRCDSSGRWLLGTTSGSHPLSVVSSQSSKIQFGQASDQGGFLFSDGAGSFGIAGGGYYNGTNWIAKATASSHIRDDGDGDIKFHTNSSLTAGNTFTPTERMRIKSDGVICMNTSSPPGLEVLQVKEATGGGGGYCILTQVTNTGGVNHLRFINPNGVVGSITTSGSATAFNTSSDYRLKENVTAVSDGIARLQQLKPSRFNFIADPVKTVDGFIAHEVQAVVPEAVHGTKDEVDADGKPIYQGIDQSKLVPLLTAALQEAVAKIESLETRLAALEVTP